EYLVGSTQGHKHHRADTEAAAHRQVHPGIGINFIADLSLADAHACAGESTEGIQGCTEGRRVGPARGYTDDSSLVVEGDGRAAAAHQAVRVGIDLLHVQVHRQRTPRRWWKFVPAIPPSSSMAGPRAQKSSTVVESQAVAI